MFEIEDSTYRKLAIYPAIFALFLGSSCIVQDCAGPCEFFFIGPPPARCQ